MTVTREIAPAGRAAGGHCVVSAGHKAAAAAGAAVRQAGGNAWDAVVAAAFASFVVEPAQCGVGGYARVCGYHAPRRAVVSVDAYLRAPEAVAPDMFEVDESRPVKYYETPWTVGLKAEKGHLSVGVPGAVAGLWEAHLGRGKLPWSTVVEPAVALAEQGLRMDWAQLLLICEHDELLSRFRPLREHLCPGGALPRIDGQFGGATVLDLGELAATLRLIADEGPAGFYEGPVAGMIEREVLGGGGVMTAADLARYRPKILTETLVDFAGYRVATCFCPTSCEFLNLLNRFPVADMGGDSVAYRHVMAECMAAAFVDTIRWYGDPDFEDAPVGALCSPAFADRRVESISMDRALARPVAPVHPGALGIGEGPLPDVASPDEPWPPRLGGTTQVAAVDDEGNMAAACISLSDAHGSLVYCPGTGVILNNGMQNFDPRPGRPNSIGPGKMPIFAAPVLLALRDGEPRFAAAGSGGYRILTGVMHSFVNWAVHGMSMHDAGAAARVHCQGRDTFVDRDLPGTTKQALAAMGHALREQRDSPGLNAFGRVCAVRRDPVAGTLEGMAYPGFRGAVAAR